jgi:hypothetical protein
MESLSRTIGSLGLFLVAFAVGLLVSLKFGDIMNHELVASGHRSREFLSYVRFLVAFFVPSLMWLVLVMVTISTRQQIRKQIRWCTGIGFALAILAGELSATFVYLVRYV